MLVKPSFFRVTTIVMTAAMLWACDGSVRREGPAVVDFQIVRADAERNRLWVLEPDAVTLYDITNARRLRSIVLPELILVGANERVCPPDIAVDAGGTVFISSNAVPVVWRIDPVRFEVTRTELALDAETDKDVGFTGLSFAADGVLLAAGSTFGSLWRIDLRQARASKVASYPSASVPCNPAALLLAAGKL